MLAIRTVRQIVINYSVYFNIRYIVVKLLSILVLVLVPVPVLLSSPYYAFVLIDFLYTVSTISVYSSRVNSLTTSLITFVRFDLEVIALVSLRLTISYINNTIIRAL